MQTRQIALPALLLAAAPSVPDVRFTDVARAVGIDFEHANSATSNKYLLETMGGGVALLDYDNDGRLDVFFTNGAKLDDPMAPGQRPEKSDRRYWNRLYHQKSDGAFENVTEKAGLTGMPQDLYGMGAAVGDYDNDGFEDLYVTSYGGNTLYHNNGDGTFRDVTARARQGSSPSWPRSHITLPSQRASSRSVASTCPSAAAGVKAVMSGSMRNTKSCLRVASRMSNSLRPSPRSPTTMAASATRCSRASAWQSTASSTRFWLSRWGW